MPDVSINEVVFGIFKNNLEKKGLSISSVDPDGLIRIRRGDTDVTVSLENVTRNYERDRDERFITDLIETITATTGTELALWTDVKEHIYVSLLPLSALIGDPIYQPVTMVFGKVYVLVSDSKLVFIDYSELERWGISLEQLADQANKNADLLVEQASIEAGLVEGRKLGMIEHPFASLKTALLFAPSFRQKAEPEFGFPFYAVMPVRDFCYIFSEEDFDFFTARIGTVIVDEYRKSGYPLTTEVLKFDEDGVDAVGAYPAD
ncbi:hypothetical protein LZZ85_01515 [Terrimonas sp. NA20]|uniref:DUF1444 domain-containing protein n=1 Tax=Terrimonas ginsenosidimutans TaxID=2908004 RepID=A0ABS9KKT6_9BACT|nr:hypothetical protein [Terrimonas ginsenosidimutans]MCG2612929.1 hypothetical protein [Terrimonas ginsenosidimutans]